jgi:speckle-type POZ protein
MPPKKIKNAKVSTGWQSFHFNLQNFKDLPTTRNHYVETPLFSFNGHEWDLTIYPGGDDEADEGYVSIFLFHRSEGSITANYKLMIMDKFGEKRKEKKSKKPGRFEGMGDGYSWDDLIKRSDILDKSKNILDSDGTLTVAVSIKEEPSDVFVPNNPLLKTIQGMFLNEDTADVCFEVSSADAKNGKRKKTKASELFHAHHLILKNCAPMLADLFDLEDRDGKIATTTITDVKPDVFRHLLCYVYGGSVLDGELKTHAKDIIDAADKYSIINLKLEAEASYVKSTDITMDNAMDNLLYADAKNCALLKEAVMNFMAANHYEASEKISFNDVPGHLMKDLLVAFGRNSKNGATDDVDELTTLSVSDLRRKLAEKGLDVDGSREAMIESIKDNATDSEDDGDENGGGDDEGRGDNEDD